jgi:predicted GNAT superfamily acetyltransferase
VVLLEVPAFFQQIKKDDIKLARDWRLLTRALFEEYFDDGYVVVDFLSDAGEGRRRNFYVLEHKPTLSISQETTQLTAEDRAVIQPESH